MSLIKLMLSKFLETIIDFLLLLGEVYINILSESFIINLFSFVLNMLFLYINCILYFILTSEKVVLSCSQNRIGNNIPKKIKFAVWVFS